MSESDIGKKGATNLVKEYGPLEDLLERAGEITARGYGKKLTEHEAAARLSKELVTIHTDLPIDFDAGSLALEDPDYDALREICWQLDFNSLAQEFETALGHAAEPPIAVPAPARPGRLSDLSALHWSIDRAHG